MEIRILRKRVPEMIPINNGRSPIIGRKIQYQTVYETQDILQYRDDDQALWSDVPIVESPFTYEDEERSMARGDLDGD